MMRCCTNFLLCKIKSENCVVAAGRRNIRKFIDFLGAVRIVCDIHFDRGPCVAAKTTGPNTCVGILKNRKSGSTY